MSSITCTKISGTKHMQTRSFGEKCLNALNLAKKECNFNTGFAIFAEKYMDGLHYLLKLKEDKSASYLVYSATMLCLLQRVGYYDTLAKQDSVFFMFEWKFWGRDFILIIAHSFSSDIFLLKLYSKGEGDRHNAPQQVPPVPCPTSLIVLVPVILPPIFSTPQIN